MKGFQVKLSVKPIENLDKPAHMGAFEPVRQIDIHIHPGQGRLGFTLLIENNNRVGDGFDAHLANIDAPGVVEILDIFHAGYGAAPWQGLTRGP